MFKIDCVGAAQVNKLSVMYDRFSKNKILMGCSFIDYYSDELNANFKCVHLNKKHCAKNMCQSCYHQRGNSRMAFKCEHTNKPNYSKGQCKNCYLSVYYTKQLKNKRKIK